MNMTRKMNNLLEKSRTESLSRKHCGVRFKIKNTYKMRMEMKLDETIIAPDTLKWDFLLN